MHEDAPTDLVGRLGYPPDARLLIINADDLGMCHAANVGALDSLNRGVATSASLMVPAPWAPAAAAAADCERLSIGVHLVLTAEWRHYRWCPLTDAPSLRLDDGSFLRSVAGLLVNAEIDQVREELTAQIERALAWGIDVTHLDAHCYAVADHEELFDVYLELALQYRLPIRLAGSAADPSPLRLRAKAAGVVTADHLVALDRMGSRPFLLAALDNLPAGVTEFHAHPAVDTPELRALAPDWAARVDDYRLYCADELFRSQLADSGAHLIRHSELRQVMRAG